MVDIAPNTPVLVGVGALQSRYPEAEYESRPEAIALMEMALRAAADDAGVPTLPAMADEILVPKGVWKYSDPARLLARALGAENATTVLAELGVLQQSLITRACQRIERGEASVVMVAGAEAKYRRLCAKIAGCQAVETVQDEESPDLVLEPEAELWSEVESAAGLGMPVGYYAIIDSALRYRRGESVEQHRDSMARLYARFSQIAGANPDAWVDDPVDPAFIREPSASNRMLAFPYTRLHNSQWNVDQGGGLIFCSVAVARELGIPQGNWVFPRASTEANFMSVTASRADLGASPGFRIAGEVAGQLAGLDISRVTLREIYSCFPAAVRVQQDELGLAEGGDLTVTGGMTFAGGPLNNYVFQATVKMARRLREMPGETGLVTSVSGMLTKQACALWSMTPGPWAFADVTDRVRAETRLCQLEARYSGQGVVAGYTVLFQGGQPWRGVAVFDLPGGGRTVAYTEDAGLIERLMGEEQCGKSFTLGEGKFSL